MLIYILPFELYRAYTKVEKRICMTTLLWKSISYYFISSIKQTFKDQVKLSPRPIITESMLCVFCRRICHLYITVPVEAWVTFQFNLLVCLSLGNKQHECDKFCRRGRRRAIREDAVSGPETSNNFDLTFNRVLYGRSTFR